MKGNLRYYSLRNNYRTCSNIMKIMEKYFFAWSKEGLVSLVGVSFIATLLNYFTGGAFGRKWFMTYHSALLSPITWVRAFTHILGHADWTHLAGNMSYLLLLGPMLEEKYSSQNTGRGGCNHGCCYQYCKLYFLPGCWFVRRQWCGVCLYPDFFFHWFKRERNTAHLYSGCSVFYRAAGI